MPSNRQESTTPWLNFLVAYPYCKQPIFDVLKTQTTPYRFLLDSGAFTAHSLGKTIRLDDYCKFLETMPIKPWRYFQLDVIGDPEKTARNYEIMRERGFNPVPVFTYNESLSRLDELYKTSDLVAVGGLVGNKNRKYIVKKVMDYVKGKNVHLLGFTNDDYLKYFKPYMCDCSSLLAAQKFGQLQIYVGHGQTEIFHKTDFRGKPPERIMRILARWGFEPERLSEKANWINNGTVDKPSLHQYVSCYSWVLKSIEYEKNIGTKLFLSVTNSKEVSVLFKSYRKIMENKCRESQKG